MEIRIHVEAARPPAGWVRLPGGEPIRFDGWLSLLAILERFDERLGAAPDGLGGELHT